MSSNRYDAYKLAAERAVKSLKAAWRDGPAPWPHDLIDSLACDMRAAGLEDGKVSFDWGGHGTQDERESLHLSVWDREGGELVFLTEWDGPIDRNEFRVRAAWPDITAELSYDPMPHAVALIHELSHPTVREVDRQLSCGV